jgi:hypothetical protein
MGSARRNRPSAALSIAGFLAVVLLGGGPAWAQAQAPQGSSPPAAGTPAPGMGVTVTPRPSQPPPSRDWGFEPALPPEQGSPREEDHGERTRTIFQPAFVKGAVKTTRTSRTSGVRYGLSGWTGSRIPFDDRESSGFPAFGFTIEWGTPMEPPAEPPKPGQR